MNKKNLVIHVIVFSQKAVGVVYATLAFASEKLGTPHVLSVDFSVPHSAFNFESRKR
jgi:hypothetical protein